MASAVEGVPTTSNGVPPIVNAVPPSPASPADQANGQQAAETPPVAAQEAPAKPVEPPKDRMSERFALLARRERDIVQKQMDGQRQIAAIKAKLKAEGDALAAERERFQEMSRRFEAAQTDPKGFLRSLYGTDYYDHITKLQLSEDEAPPAEMQMRAIREEMAKTTEDLKREQAELRDRIESEKKAAIAAEKERLSAEANQTLESFNSEVVDFVKSNSAKYELINLYDRHDLVPMVIRATYEQSKANGTPRLLSSQEAADVVENYLSEELAKAQRLKQPKTPQEAQPTNSTPPVQPPAPTLSNAMGTPAVPVKASTGDFRTDAMRRALAAWEAKEKK